MTDKAKYFYKPFTQAQVDELTAMYDDFLRGVRLHEQLLHDTPIADLAVWQIEDAYSKEQIENIPSNAFGYPWESQSLTDEEEQEFAEFINNNVFSDENKAFVILQHIKSEENTVERPIFTLPPYILKGINMELPSSIERCNFAFSKNALLGNTEFYVDGLYKLVYTDEKRKNEPVINIIKDQQILTEFCIAINMTECFLRNENILNEDWIKMNSSVLATEKIIKNENVILETLSSFIEKFQNVLRQRYESIEVSDVFTEAQQEGLIHSADDFQHYMNIRHFIRHQWDSLDGFGCFSSDQSAKNIAMRAKYVESYLKFFSIWDTSIIQRMKSYVNILHQIQSVIGIINPSRITRGISESNSKFTKRAKIQYANNKDVTFELNWPLLHKKHFALNKTMNKVLPQANVVDDYVKTNDSIEHMNLYITRSWFLETLLSLECTVMQHCLTRGHNFKKSDAWRYLEQIGVLSHEEFDKWHNYIQLRNMLSHNYFDENLRGMLCQTKESFDLDSQSLNQKLVDSRGPGVKRVQNKIYKFGHKDRLLVSLDFDTYTISQRSMLSRMHYHRKRKKESYPNGVEFTLINQEIVDITTPMGISVNLYNQNINWDVDMCWRRNGKKGYILKNQQDALITDEKLRVVKFIKNGQRQSVAKRESLLLGSQYKIALDDSRRIKEFKFEKVNGGTVSAIFNHAKAGYNTISLNDGTNILQSGPEIVVTHGGKTLLHDENQDFVATYNAIQEYLQQNVRPEDVR